MGLVVTILLFSFLVLAGGEKGSFSESPNVPHWSKVSHSDYHFSPAEQAMHSVSSSLAAEYQKLADPHDYPEHYSPVDEEVFDFIVVGAGSAGSVVANRLTEVPSWRVLLLEAGGNPTKTSEIPNFCRYLLNSKLDWKYRTEPDGNNCLGMEGHSCNWNRGKGLGGSSSINSMVYIRGNAENYNRWEAEGCSGWGFENVLYYFKKSQDMRIKDILRTPDFRRFHSTGGYLKVENFYSDQVQHLVNAFAGGMHELGYDENFDINGRNQSGFIKLPGNLENGRRCSTANAFLKPIKHRCNLRVSKWSLVTKVLIDQNTQSAVGVTFIDQFGKLVTVRASKEVILSSGAINSPQLLMLSGIGPKRHLDELNIRVVQDLPGVGENLQDHMNMFGLVISLNHTKSKEILADSMYEFLMKGKGPLSGAGLHSYSAFVHSRKGMNYPDFSLLLADYGLNDRGLERELKTRSFTQDVVNKFIEINRESSIVLISCSLLRPYSRGSIRLKGKDPRQYPKLVSGYLTDYRDVETFLRIYDFLEELTNTRALRMLDAKLHEIQVPGCWRFAFASKEYRECSMRHLTTTQYHFCGSCKMGPASSPLSVVDPWLRVRGINKLRVIDASVMPRITSGNINAAVIMIGEKGADLIKETWLRMPWDYRISRNKLNETVNSSI